MTINTRLTFCLAVAAIVAAGAPSAFAQTAAKANGDWSNANTWTAGEPGLTSVATIDGGFAVTITEGLELAARVDVGNAAGQSGTLTMQSGDLTIVDDPNADDLPSIRIGQALDGVGTFNMHGGSVIIDGPAADSGFAIGDLMIGDVGDATMTMTDGDIFVSDEMIIAAQASSTATATISGGTIDIQRRSLLVGFHGDGTLNVSGTADIRVNFDLLMAFQPGSTATFNQSGGKVSANVVFTNSFTGGAGSTAVINMTGGEFVANFAYVLGQGNGTTVMNHSGGIINAPTNNGDMVVADGDGNTSTYNISGTAEVNLLHNFLVGVFDGPEGPANGTVNQTGGTITAGDNIVLGRDGVGAWNLSAGSVSASGAFLGDFDSSYGTMKITGGSLNLSGNLNVGAAIASNAAPDRVEPNGMNGAQGQAVDANGTLIIEGTGGQINVGNLLANPADKSPLRNGPGQENSSTLQFNLSAGGVSTIEVAQIADLDGAVIDINDIGGYFTANPMASLTLITAGSGFGNVYTNTPTEAASTGMAFSLAPSDDPLYDLAIVNGAGSSQSLVLTKAEGVSGDLDNDGDVDGTDFLFIQRNYGTTTNASHLAAWRAEFGSTAQAASGAVPEPTGALLAVAMGMVGLAGARRRGR